ncbi:MAG: NOB1 family endonuclease [Thermoplasmata archaeon]
MGKKLILDTSAIISGRPFPTDVETYTVPGVIDEIKINEEYYPVLENIKIIEPDDENLEKAYEAARKTGDINKLSPTDLEIISAAIEFRFSVVTDDYAIQNVLNYLKLDYITYAQEGIKELYIWIYRCTGCKRTYSRNFGTCPVCGSPLKLTRIKKKNNRNF